MQNADYIASDRAVEPLVFRSKVDAWLAAVLLTGAMASVGAVVAVAAVQAPLYALLLSPIVLLGAVLPLWILMTTDYTLAGGELRVRCGPFRWRVPLHAIRAVEPTRDPLSSPALSLDRLRIDYGRYESIMISPADKERFLSELERRRSAA